MDNRPLSGTTAPDHSVWVILAGLIVLAVLVGFGALALINATQQVQAPTGSQTVPTSQ